MKILDKFILKSFAGPYILSFFIAEFVLIMQFLWKYIDDILGKGFSAFEVLELLIYYGANIMPMALPISILLSSVMVFGDISEKYELSSFKSAGISLLRIMKPAIMLSIATFLLSIIASNFIKPAATFQFKKRFDLIKRQKATLSFEEGIFNNEFSNMVVRIGKKDQNGIDVQNVMIYDHTLPDKSLVNFILADTAKMFSSKDGNYFIMDLEKGEQVQEMERNNQQGKMQYPMIRTSFEKWHKTIDMSDFYLKESDLSISRNKEDMLNTLQLLVQIDTINNKLKQYNEGVHYDFGKITKASILDEATYLSQRSDAHKNQIIAEQKNQAPPSLQSNTASTQNSKNQKNNNPKISDTKKPVSPAAHSQTNKQSKDNIPPVIFDYTSKDMADYEKSFMKMKEREEMVRKQKRKLNDKDLAALGDTTITNSTAKKDLSTYYKRLNVYDIHKIKSIAETYDSTTLKNLASTALPMVSFSLEKSTSGINNNDYYLYQKQVYLYRLNQQYSFAFICILFLFIGAPLGSIIRKGGYGYPLLIAILFYILFIITHIVGEKLLKTERIEGVIAAWLPCLIMIPFSFYFTYQALQDVRFTWFERLEQWVIKRFSKKSIPSVDRQ